MKFNEKILDLRKKKGLSQEELGRELNVSRQTISKWESGQSYPDFEKLVLLSDFFELTLDELMKDIDVQDIKEKNHKSIDISYFESVLKTIIKSIVWFGWFIIIIVVVCAIGSLITTGKLIQP
ncbi:helix-turn-helix domain-containing protein [Romboutsia sp. 1001713B170131_170501_G6]|uniref:helix-turn-helix domain-containing protein n=1 Tax=Romboutsia sp. 1001713B170131_170501_G6 TaxID=2787108 RepID=UPI0018A92780|nr:helix-turn-helix transcriptional regulator [Romboutsia sp. 1001713B170131_170501_G6]